MKNNNKKNKNILRKGLLFNVGIALVAAVVILGITSRFFTNAAEASWFDEDWLYRAAVPISSHTSAESNVYITITVDTATPIAAGKMQSDCGDIRLTKENGDILPYFINASPGCNNVATTIQVNFDSFPAGAQDIYMYYGNPSAADGFNGGAFTTEASNYALGTVGSETQGPGPVGYWRFDDGQGTTAQDSSASNLDGTLNNTPAWQTENMCVAGKCLYFDGSNNENVSKSDDAKLDFAAADNFTVSAWVRKSGASSANTVILGKASANIGSTYQGYKLYMDASGDFCFDTQDGTLSVDSACTTAVDFDDDKWYLVQGVKTGTTKIELYVDGALRASDASIASTGSLANSGTFYVGIDSDGLAIEWKGFIDEVKVYNYARSAAQIKTDYASRGAAKGVSAAMDGAAQSYLSNGLVGYWKMDEASGNAADSSGNGVTLTNNSSMASSTGKFGNSVQGDGTADYLSTATTISSVQTIAFWVNPANSTDNYINLTGSTVYINSSSGIVSATGITSPSIYVNGVLNGTVTASAWNHIAITTASAITASQFEVGRANNAYAVSGSKLDEVRIYNRALSPKEVSDLYNFAPGPVGYWRMDDKVSGNSQTIVDTSGNANNGTTNWGANASGMSCQKSGKYGGACSFDGVDDYVNLGSKAAHQGFENNVTMEAWVKINSTAPALSIAFGKSNTTGATNTQYPLVLAVAGGNADVRIYYDAVYNAQWSTTLTVGRWYHIAGTYDQTLSSNNIKLYVDGVLRAQTSFSQSLTTNTRNLYIGDRINTPDYPLNGMVDDVKIYNYARTQKQIVSDMNAGHPAVGSPVGSAVGYWKFDEGQGTTANDSTSNANSLTLSSASWTDSGKFGKAWNGTGSIWLSRADDSDFDATSTDDYAVALWFKSDSASNPGAVEYLFNKAAAATAGYAVYANTSGNICFGIDDDTSWGPDVSSCSPTDIYDNTWHHIMAVRDHNNTDKTLIYIDGVLKDSDTDSTSATLDNSLSLYIGDRDGTDNGDEFNGDLDEIKVYRYALTADEVKTEYNRGSSLQLGAAGNNSTYAPGAANQEYCVPGDTTSCAAPIGRWDFEEKTGTSANDTSGNGNTLTLTNSPTYTIGKVGAGINFAGSDAHLIRADDSDFDFAAGGSFTLEAWVKHSAASAQEVILSKFNEAGYKLLMENDGDITCGIDYDSTWTPADSVASTAATYDDNKWHHISCVKNANTSLTLYIDGVSVGTPDTSLTNSTLENTDPLYIGIDADATSNDWIGQIDEVRIFSYARTAAQIAWDYNRGGPVGWWKMDECQGATANDSSGNSNTGTWSGTGAGTQTAVGTCAANAATAWYNGATGKLNYSLSFDGTDDYLSQSPITSLTTNLTFSAWIKWDTTAAGFDAIYNSGTASGNWRVNIDASNRLGFTEDGVADYPSTGAITKGTWNHVVVVKNGDSDSNLAFYLNGLAAGTASVGTVVTPSGTAYLSSVSGTTQFFNGLIDDVKIFNYALTPVQVKTLYNNGAINFGPTTGSP